MVPSQLVSTRTGVLAKAANGVNRSLYTLCTARPWREQSAGWKMAARQSRSVVRIVHRSVRIMVEPMGRRHNVMTGSTRPTEFSEMVRRCE